MPPVRTLAGRASKACGSCRKAKTRCHPGTSGACLRCNTLGLQCSLQSLQVGGSDIAEQVRASREPGVRHDCSLLEDRFAALERVVAELAKVVESKNGSATSSDVLRSPPRSDTEIPGGTRPPPNLEPPIVVIRDAISDVSSQTQSEGIGETIIEKGILALNETKELLDLFLEHYGRWVQLRETDSSASDLDVWSSPLLQCACCLIAVRHWSGPTARDTADMLFQEAKSLLSQQLLQAPQPLSFFRAALILSLWSTTIGQQPLSVDSWMVTGFAIQHGAASRVFAPLRTNVTSNLGKCIGKMLLWSRIYLAHLHACISIRRPSMIGQSDIDRLTTSLPADQLSNFELRLVAEMNLYWTIYETLQAAVVRIPQSQAALQSWKTYWSFLFDQPRSQFLKMGYHFAQLLIFEQALTNKSAAVRESLVSEMVTLSSSILQIAMDTADDRTKHLTDHIYHMIAFAAVTLCRLIYKYEPQLSSNQSINKLDDIIFEIVEWLGSLGSDTHIGHMMGKVVDAVHRKLRPEVHAAYQQRKEEEQFTPDPSLFPDLLGLGFESLEFDWDAMVPDWQSLASDEALATSVAGLEEQHP